MVIHGHPKLNTSFGKKKSKALQTNLLNRLPLPIEAPLNQTVTSKLNFVGAGRFMKVVLQRDEKNRVRHHTSVCSYQITSLGLKLCDLKEL